MSYEKMLNNKPDKKETTSEGEPAEIIHCECINTYQDTTYGKGNRVFNPTCKVNSSAKRIYRCTVCKAEKNK